MNDIPKLPERLRGREGGETFHFILTSYVKTNAVTGEDLITCSGRSTDHLIQRIKRSNFQQRRNKKWGGQCGNGFVLSLGAWDQSLFSKIASSFHGVRTYGTRAIGEIKKNIHIIFLFLHRHHRLSLGPEPRPDSPTSTRVISWKGKKAGDTISWHFFWRMYFRETSSRLID